MSGLFYLVILVIAYFIGCAVLNSMGIIMIGSFSSLIIRPIVIGLLVILVTIGILKMLFTSVFGWIILIGIGILIIGSMFK